MKLKALPLLFVALLLTACSAISSGYITDKDYLPGHYYYITTCTLYDSKGLCSMWTPIPHWQDDQWRFDIKDNDDTGWVYVTEDTYNSYEIGAYYSQE